MSAEFAAFPGIGCGVCRLFSGGAYRSLPGGTRSVWEISCRGSPLYREYIFLQWTRVFCRWHRRPSIASYLVAGSRRAILPIFSPSADFAFAPSASCVEFAYFVYRCTIVQSQPVLHEYKQGSSLLFTPSACLGACNWCTPGSRCSALDSLRAYAPVRGCVRFDRYTDSGWRVKQKGSISRLERAVALYRSCANHPFRQGARHRCLSPPLASPGGLAWACLLLDLCLAYADYRLLQIGIRQLSG